MSYECLCVECCVLVFCHVPYVVYDVGKYVCLRVSCVVYQVALSINFMIRKRRNVEASRFIIATKSAVNLSKSVLNRLRKVRVDRNSNCNDLLSLKPTEVQELDNCRCRTSSKVFILVVDPY